jgi:hypothetical protein
LSPRPISFRAASQSICCSLCGMTQTARNAVPYMQRPPVDPWSQPGPPPLYSIGSPNDLGRGRNRPLSLITQIEVSGFVHRPKSFPPGLAKISGQKATSAARGAWAEVIAGNLNSGPGKGFTFSRSIEYPSSYLSSTTRRQLVQTKIVDQQTWRVGTAQPGQVGVAMPRNCSRLRSSLTKLPALSES